MTIGTRLILWFSGVLVVALLAMSALCYNELVIEPRTQREHKQPVEPPLEELAEALTTCAAPALILGFAGGWWLSRRAMAPVRSLTRAAERLNEHNLGEQLPRTRNHDELDRLTGVFNDMSARMQQSFSRIREFTLHASHELKTPLTVMHGELETALARPNLTLPERSRLESQLDEVQRLTRIVDGLTLLTKADAGQVKLASEPLRLDELVEEATADAQSLGRSQQLQVILAKTEPVQIMGDRHRLRQLLLNLTDNAVKYNRPGGSVSFSLQRNNGSAEVAISNTGPGIGADDLPKVFEPFFRGDKAHSTNGTPDGCGLGLSIARWIARSHQGEIYLASDSGNTTATVRLPVVDPH
jgi:signal transduction histidine kinase